MLTSYLDAGAPMGAKQVFPRHVVMTSWHAAPFPPPMGTQIFPRHVVDFIAQAGGMSLQQVDLYI